MQAYRWALLGNAVSVPVAAWVGRALMEPLRLKYVCGPDDHALEGDYEG